MNLFKRLLSKAKPFKTIGYTDYITNWTNDRGKKSDETFHRIIMKMNEDGERKAEWPKYKDYSKEHYSLNSHPVTEKIKAWEAGGPLPDRGFTPLDDSQVIELLNNILKKKMKVPDA